MATLKVYANFDALATGFLEEPTRRMAEAFAESLRKNISAGTRSGRQYPGARRRSSAPNEFPQEQTSELVRSVAVVKGPRKATYRVVFQGVDPAKAHALEFGRDNMAKRAPIARTAAQAETRRKMLLAATEGR